MNIWLACGLKFNMYVCIWHVDRKGTYVFDIEEHVDYGMWIVCVFSCVWPMDYVCIWM